MKRKKLHDQNTCALGSSEAMLCINAKSGLTANRRAINVSEKIANFAMNAIISTLEYMYLVQKMNLLARKRKYFLNEDLFAIKVPIFGFIIGGPQNMNEYVSH